MIEVYAPELRSAPMPQIQQTSCYDSAVSFFTVCEGGFPRQIIRTKLFTISSPLTSLKHLCSFNYTHCSRSLGAAIFETFPLRAALTNVNILTVLMNPHFLAPAS